MAIDRFGRDIHCLRISLTDRCNLILEGVWYKPWGHGLAEGIIPLNRVMNEIGG